MSYVYSKKTDFDALESSVERNVIKHAKKKKWLHRKVKWIGRNGAPDDLFSKIRRGKPVSFFIEFKRPGEELRAKQDREIALMRKHGLTVHVIDEVEDGCALFD